MNDDIAFDKEEDEEEATSTLNFHPGGDDGGSDGDWMTSYADMMTLIACFFILMMVFANYDAASFQRKAELMAKYFQGENDISESSKMSTSIKQHLKTISNIDDNIVVKDINGGVEVVINLKALFKIGSADLNPDYQFIFDGVINKIKESNDDVRIIVEGHTDDIPFKSANSYGFRSNWQLSGARAATVAKFFDEKGFERSSIVAAGFADTRPAFPNRDKKGIPIPENQQKNRRIVLKVYQKPKHAKQMGLGVIFNKDEAPKKEIPAEDKKIIQELNESRESR